MHFLGTLLLIMFVGMKPLYRYNHSFFSEIDSEAKAYCLGLIFFDGNIHSTRNVISITLTDMDTVSYIRDNIAPDKPLYEVKKKSNRHSQAYTFECSSAIMKRDLICLGCTPNKSLTVRYPDIPEHLNSHFIRGAFDADGNIYTNNGNIDARITSGSNEMLSDIASILSSVGIKSSIYSKGGDQPHIMALSVTYNMARMFRDYMYSGSTVSMARKRDRFFSIKEPRDISGYVEYSSEDISRILEMYSSGKSSVEIATEYNTYSMKIYRILKRNNVNTKRR